MKDLIYRNWDLQWIVHCLMNFGRYSFIQILVCWPTKCDFENELLLLLKRYWSNFLKIQIKWKTFMRFLWSCIEHGSNDCFRWSNFLVKIAFSRSHNVFVFESLWQWYFNGKRWTKEKCHVCTLYLFVWIYLTNRFFWFSKSAVQ